MFEYFAHSLSRVWSQRAMFASAYGPLLSSDFTFTHITGSPWAAFITRPILVARPTFEPAATSAVSLVPRAMTQQPRNPPRVMVRIASYPLIWPGRTSTTELAPDMSVTTERTPTSSYWAVIRSPG